MRITDLLKPEAVAIDASASTRDEVIDQLVALHVAAGNVTDATAYKAGVLAREAEFSTAVGEGIAIPHAKVAAVAQAGLAAMTVPAGVDWNAPDEKPCDLVFMIAAPEGKNNLHLEMLAKLSALLMHEDFAAELRAAKTLRRFLAAIDAAEAARDEAEATREAAAAHPKAAASDWPEVLAITACPTGIAHTYMAAENLRERRPPSWSVTLKAETQGSAGAKNVLTAEEIAHCKGVVIAADKNVDLSRFDGKPVYVTNVSAGINDAEKLIDVVLSGKAPIHHNAGGAAAPAEAGEAESAWHKVYKHLMNGVSHMLPFVIGGGILTAIAFLVDQPGLGTAAYGSSIPAAALFKTIGGGPLTHAAHSGGLHRQLHRRQAGPGAGLRGRPVCQGGLRLCLPGHARLHGARLRRLHRRALRGLCGRLHHPGHRARL